MAAEKIGRNDPCPCGSGKKYKHCCLRRQQNFPQTASKPITAQEYLTELRKAVESRRFASEEERKAFVQAYHRDHRQVPIEDFCGLSTEQMNRLLNHPFDSPQLLTFPSILPSTPSAPILTLFQLIAEAIGDKGLKPTAKGNLPLEFVRKVILAYYAKDETSAQAWLSHTRSELNLPELRRTRVIAEMAGLIRKYKGKFILSRECRKLLSEHGLSGIYPRLLRAYAERFDWRWEDIYAGVGFIQRAFPFTLYLLHRYGDQWRSNEFYEDAFVRAFRSVVETAQPLPHFTLEDTVRRSYTLRSFEHFALFLGLIEIKRDPDPHSDRFELRKLPLLDGAVVFSI